eukprot:jgi/Bigna1/130368/aug1.11_g5076
MYVSAKLKLCSFRLSSGQNPDPERKYTALRRAAAQGHGFRKKLKQMNSGFDVEAAHDMRDEFQTEAMDRLYNKKINNLITYNDSASMELGRAPLQLQNFWHSVQQEAGIQEEQHEEDDDLSVDYKGQDDAKEDRPDYHFYFSDGEDDNRDVDVKDLPKNAKLYEDRRYSAFSDGEKNDVDHLVPQQQYDEPRQFSYISNGSNEGSDDDAPVEQNMDGLNQDRRYSYFTDGEEDENASQSRLSQLRHSRSNANEISQLKPTHNRQDSDDHRFSLFSVASNRKTRNVHHLGQPSMRPEPIDEDEDDERPSFVLPDAEERKQKISSNHLDVALSANADDASPMGSSMAAVPHDTDRDDSSVASGLLRRTSVSGYDDNSDGRKRGPHSRMGSESKSLLQSAKAAELEEDDDGDSESYIQVAPEANGDSHPQEGLDNLYVAPDRLPSGQFSSMNLPSTAQARHRFNPQNHSQQHGQGNSLFKPTSILNQSSMAEGAVNNKGINSRFHLGSDEKKFHQNRNALFRPTSIPNQGSMAEENNFSTMIKRGNKHEGKRRNTAFVLGSPKSPKSGGIRNESSASEPRHFFGTRGALGSRKIGGRSRESIRKMERYLDSTKEPLHKFTLEYDERHKYWSRLEDDEDAVSLKKKNRKQNEKKEVKFVTGFSQSAEEPGSDSSTDLEKESPTACEYYREALIHYHPWLTFITRSAFQFSTSERWLALFAVIIGTFALATLILSANNQLPWPVCALFVSWIMIPIDYIVTRMFINSQNRVDLALNVRKRYTANVRYLAQSTCIFLMLLGGVIVVVVGTELERRDFNNVWRIIAISALADVFDAAFNEPLHIAPLIHWNRWCNAFRA